MDTSLEVPGTLVETQTGPLGASSGIWQTQEGPVQRVVIRAPSGPRTRLAGVALVLLSTCSCPVTLMRAAWRAPYLGLFAVLAILGSLVAATMLWRISNRPKPAFRQGRDLTVGAVRIASTDEIVRYDVREVRQRNLRGHHFRTEWFVDAVLREGPRNVWSGHESTVARGAAEEATWLAAALNRGLAWRRNATARPA